MEPELNIGDIVVVKSASEDDLREGDIISYRDGQAVVTHRITEIKENDKGEKEFQTKGDNNNTKDSKTIKINLIEGKVINSISRVGKLAIMLQDKIFIIFIIILFYGYLVRCEKVKKRAERRKSKRIDYEKNMKKEG